LSPAHAPSRQAGRGRVAIVGGGVAGCAAATLLREQGHDVTLFEAVDDPRPVGAGLLLQPTGQAVLERLGLLAEVLMHGAPVDRLFGDNAAGRTVLNMSYRRFAPGCFGLGIQRGTLFGLAWRRMVAAGCAVRLGTPVEGFQQDADGVTLAGRDGAALGRFDALVLANGSFSTLRAGMAVPQSQAPFPWGALWAVLPAPADFAAVELRQRFRSAREMVGLMPVGRALDAPAGAPRGVNFFWSLPLADVPAWQAGSLDAWKTRVRNLMPACAPLLEAVTSHGQLRVARYADVWMKQWHDRRVVAIGDAGHGMSPQLGQGANMALIDAWVLAHCLRGARGDAGGPVDWARAFASYTRERLSHLRFYQRSSVALTPLFQSHRRVAPWVRDLFFGLPGRLSWVHDHSVAALAGLKTGWLAGRLDLSRYDPPAAPGRLESIA
jgi:2-polyprenyl-6-methoxyphenol hydroxylase-like FAD-dependent oxidoreductase